MTMNAEQQYIELFSQTEAMPLPILSESDSRPAKWRSTNIRM